VFLREVDEALRQDQMLGLAKRYGKPIGAVVAAGLLGLAGYLWWDYSSQADAAQRSEKFLIALDNLDTGARDAAEKELAPIASEGGDGSQAAAALLQAGILLEKGKQAEAIKAYAAIAADDSLATPFRDLATIREISASFDTLPPAQIEARLKPLAVPGNAWFGSAGELLGMAYLKQGKDKQAGTLFAAVARDKTVPDSLRSRVRQMAGLLGVDAVDDVAQAAGDAAAASAAEDTAAAQ